MKQYRIIGDFTGYKHKQFLSSVYRDEYTRLVFKGNLFNKTNQNFYTFKLNASITDWINKSWHHVFVTYKSNAFILYIDGIKHEETSFSRDAQINYSNQPAYYIGTTTPVNNVLKKPLELFNGKLADIKVYNYCLDFTKIQSFLRSFL